MAASKAVRVDGGIVAAAEAVAALADRSTTEQVNRWARIGWQFSMATSVDQRAIERVVRGEEQLAGLTETERAIANAVIDAEIAERVAAASFGEVERKRGFPTVAIDDEGRLVETAADGTATYL